MSDLRREQLLEALRHHVPEDLREAAALRRTRAYLRWLPRPFDEHADPTHVTASAVVLDGLGRVLLHRHRLLGAWMQPGGHLEPGEAPADACVRETLEETGITATHPGGGEPMIVHLDAHDGGRGHLHLDLRYLLTAPADALPAPGEGESPEVAWVDTEQARSRGDRSFAAALRAALTTWRGGPR